jgi:trehalose 6-phosphate phosphatase
MKNIFKAAILDLDGVLTQTAAQHAKAWKAMFDQYNQLRKKQGQETFEEFSIKNDYPKYIDGLPRYDGVKNFLDSRKVEIPYGSPQDAVDEETICGLGNMKNEKFLQVVKDEGVEIFEKNIEQIRKWRDSGMKTAVISSSKNCKQILEVSGIEGLFDVRVDGVVSAERGIPGKPAPDIFLEAARELDVSPKEALVVEDAIAGVEAGRKGGFGLVIGIINGSDKEELLRNGADKAVNNLMEINLNTRPERTPQELPAVLQHLDKIEEKLKSQKLMLFLDFDGTLAPIVERHEDAGISPEMKELVEQLASKHSVAVISGRGLKDVKSKMGLEDIFYAGSHGFEISGPDGFHKENDEAQEVLHVFDELEPKLKEKLSDIEGVRFERKKFTLAVHYRQVAGEKEGDLMSIMDETLKDYPQVIKGEGKKVVEIRPNIDWDKGKAVEMLQKELSKKEGEGFSLFVGDDITDEDAFKALSNGYGILVGDHGRKTYADYSLKDVDGVRDFLQKLIEL